MIYLRDIRQYRGMTMKELGYKVGITESAIGLYETGKRKPNYEMLLKLAEALECSVEEILNGPKNFYGPEECFDDERKNAEKKLFQALKGATTEDIEQATKILEALRR